MGIGPVLPAAFFASNAFYPIAMMPEWLQSLQSKSFDYEVDALRSLMLAGSATTFGIGLDFLIMFLSSVGLVVVGSKIYPNVVI
jgi:ABC-2 type transport system permease protein